MTEEPPKSNTLNRGFDDFAPLFVNWVNSILNISLSSNLAKELEDGRILLLLLNKLCPFLQLTDPNYERSAESNYIALEFGFSKLGIPGEYHIHQYYFTNGNMSPVFTSLTVLIYQLMQVVGEKALSLCPTFKSLIITTIKSIRSLRSPSLLPAYLEQLRLLDNDSLDLFTEEDSFAADVWRSMLDNDAQKFHDRGQLLYYILFRMLGDGTDDTLSRSDVEDSDPFASLSSLDDKSESLSRLCQRYLNLSEVALDANHTHQQQQERSSDHSEEEQTDALSVDLDDAVQSLQGREAADGPQSSLLSLLKSNRLLPREDSDDSLEYMPADEATENRRNNVKSMLVELL